MKRTLLTKLTISLAFLLCLAYAQESNLTVTILTGPVIGKVTNSTARVLLEFNTNAEITVILTDPSGNQKNTTRNVTGSVPFIFSFDGLQQETKYLVSLSLINGSVSNMIESYFTTLGPATGNLKFATISCFDRFFQAQKTPEADLWANLLARVKNNEIQYLIHSGDQVYMDDKLGSPSPEKPFYAIQTILSSTPREEWGNRRAEMIEILRSEYRFDWSIQSVRETLAKVPSLMIFDDHEIRDDWGYLPQDYDPNSLDYYYGGLARQVYYEYQRQLREDVDFSNYSNMTTEYFYEVLNGVAFYLIDYRGIRTWNRNYSQMNDMQLGVVQWQLLDQLLEPNVGTLAEARSFVLVSPLAVVYLVEALVEIGYFSINDAQESWTFAYVDEQARLLDLLKNWKEGRDGREVLIVDGDVHMGGWTRIKYRIDTVFNQYTSSSMASSAPSDAVFFGFDVVKELQNLKNPWTYEHHDWTNDYNYGIVIARIDGDESEVNAYMVKASFDTSPELINSDGKGVDDSDWADILSGND